MLHGFIQWIYFVTKKSLSEKLTLIGIEIDRDFYQIARLNWYLYDIADNNSHKSETTWFIWSFKQRNKRLWTFWVFLW